MQPIDDATAAFLHSAADDLQRQLGMVAAVQQVTVEKEPQGVTLVAALRIGDRRMAIRGTGANLVAAYADLRLATPERVLVGAFTEMMES